MDINFDLAMSSRNKLYKFAENLTFPNVVQNFQAGKSELIGKDYEVVERKGLWSSSQFQNESPITLELACGRGEYTLELARRYPGRNFIGVDIKGARIHAGAKQALQEQLTNVCFLRARIEFLHLFFDENEINQIWITFPDPFLKRGKENNRLTSQRYLEIYRNVLVEGGLASLKTDEPVLYQFTLEQLKIHPSTKLIWHSDQVYKEKNLSTDWEISTHYEKLHIADGDQICGAQWKYTD